jgi:serine/threonine protein kinase
MTPAQWRRVRDLFESLVDRDPAEARVRLEAEVPDDAAVRAEVLSLLDHHSRAGEFLESAPSLTSTDLRAGTVLGTYEVIREIGHGGMGQVYLALDTRLQRHVCLKAVRADIRDASFRGRLEREARTAASLTHPGICSVYALEELDGQLYLVTEFIDGHTLREEIAQGPLPARHVVETLRQVASAVGAAHAKGITHRDLKPENIMRSSDGRLKVLDFGVARVEGNAGGAATRAGTMPGALVGTLAYMAPEQLDGRPVGPRADVFALGILGYELASGVHPFAAPSPLATAAHILGTDPEPLQSRRPDVPASLARVVERCLGKRAEDRFASAAEIVSALDARGGRSVGRSRRTWWRLHQTAAIALYMVGAAATWQIKEWEPSLAARWAFLLLGMFAAVNGVVRGHLLFTDSAHPHQLAAERARTRVLTTVLDLAMAALLLLGASLISTGRPVAAVLVMGLAVGIASAAVLIEPSTSRAALNVP